MACFNLHFSALVLPTANNTASFSINPRDNIRESVRDININHGKMTPRLDIVTSVSGTEQHQSLESWYQPVVRANCTLC